LDAAWNCSEAQLEHGERYAFLTILSFLDFIEFDAVGNCGLIIINDVSFLKLLYNGFFEI
jgi:hypothetical protein